MKDKDVKVKFNKITPKIKGAGKNKKHKNILAHVALRFEGENENWFTISGFILWKSKFGEGNYNITRPSRGKDKFQFFLAEDSLWKRIKQVIIKKYEYEEIPVIEEEN